MAQLTLHLNEQKQLNIDFAEVRDVRYGLLNANAWIERISEALTKQLDDLELSGDSKTKLRKEIRSFLYQQLNNIEKNLPELSKDKGIFGRLKDRIFAPMCLDSIREQVPSIANEIVHYLTDPQGKGQLKSFIVDKLKNLSDNSLARTNMQHLDAVMTAYQCGSVVECELFIAEQITNTDQPIKQALTVLIVALLLLFLLLVRMNATPHQIFLLTLGSLALLVGGIATPMLEIEARISELSFDMLGESLVFTNQVLFYQSKSILDVVGLLVSTRQFDMIVVGVLISVFSILFPLLKLLSTWLYVRNIANAQQSSAISFFALKSGKWSMADVFVVALFMAYIGFDGMISTQLDNIAGGNQYVDVLTMNGTSLEIGFFLFLGFCISGLVISTVLDFAARRR